MICKNPRCRSKFCQKIHNHKFCCHKCEDQYGKALRKKYNEIYIKECKLCSKLFTVSTIYKKKIYCSLKCSNIDQHIWKVFFNNCKSCKKLFTSRKENNFCSSECRTKYKTTNMTDTYIRSIFYEQNIKPTKYLIELKRQNIIIKRLIR